MLTRIERPLIPAETKQIDLKLEAVKERITSAAFKIPLLIFFDIISILLGIAACVNGDRSGPVGICAGLGAVLVANVVLGLSYLDQKQGHIHQARLRRAKSDDVAVVEHIEASAAVCLRDGKWSWYLFSVEPERLVAVSDCDLILEWGHSQHVMDLPACFDRVCTSEDRLVLAILPIGNATLQVTGTCDLRELLPDRKTRRQVVARLATIADFPGRLDTLADSLVALAD
jgi:hypothetical protein